jgi:predicted nucleic acid-binding protein
VIDLDANFLVDVFRRGSSSARLLDRWVNRGESINISSVAWAEFLCGPVESRNAIDARGLLGRIEPLTDPDAVLAAELFNATGRRVRSLPDCMIAAVAIRRGARVATLDTADFGRFKDFGLKVS